MIQLGTVKSEMAARLLTDAMYLEGIAAHADENKRSEWDLWVVDMDQESAARKLLADFQSNPQEPRFVTATHRAEEKRRAEQASQKKGTAPVFTKDNMPGWSGRFELLPVTGFLMVMSIIVTLASWFGEKEAIARLFTISNVFFFGRPPLSMALPEVQHGEVWRLVTPIFLHFHPLHILFNMMWLKDLGVVLERRRGGFFLGVMVLVTAVISNVGQYLWSGPAFGGMSGVVYGLLGFIWIQGRLRPFSGLHVPQQVMTMMVIWMMLGFAGLMNMANGCHLIGLGTGMLLGAIPVPPQK